MLSIQVWTLILIAVTFLLYVVIAILTRANNTTDFFVAHQKVSPLANGAATAADWMSAASFISMAGIIAFSGRDGSRFLMGWTGGYVLLALLLAPYLRKFGKYTIPDFVGERYYSKTARVVAVICAVFVSFTYVCGQMQGVGIVFSRFLKVDITLGVAIGMLIVFFYAVLGGMKGITYTQVAQYCVLIFAFMVPAIFISIQLTGNAVPQIGFGSQITNSGEFLLERLDGLSEQLGFSKYTSGSLSTINLFCITATLMLGTAGLPHVIVRFYTVKKVKDARISVFWALFFIAILYTSAPAIAVFSRTNLLTTIGNEKYIDAPRWFKNWEQTGLVAWVDKNKDGYINYTTGDAIIGKPEFDSDEDQNKVTGEFGQLLLTNRLTENKNELYVNPDIMVLANPEIAKLPNWVIGLVAAGGLAAALSTAAGLLLVISSAIAHDLIKKTFKPNLNDQRELVIARISAAAAVLIAGYFGINPPGFVADVVALAFGLAASSFFPILLLGIFSKRVNKYGAIAGMLCGIIFTTFYIIYFKSAENTFINNKEHWLWGISPEGIGIIGMCINFIITYSVSILTPKPPKEIEKLIDFVRSPE